MRLWSTKLKSAEDAQPGEALSILHTSALEAASESTPVHAVKGVHKAVLLGFQRCAPGDLLLVGGATDVNDLQLIIESPNSGIAMVAKVSD